MDKVTKDEIKILINNQQYEEIYKKYGQNAYKKYVPRRYQNADLKNLRKEGKYEAIYNKYGKGAYNSSLTDAKYREIRDSSGVGKAIAWKIKNISENILKTVGITTCVALASATTVAAKVYDDAAVKNAKIYEKEIENFNKNTQNYAEEVRNLNLSDLQICMKVMQDMWNNIKGYDIPKIDAVGYFELDLATEDGVGECRNMANYAAKTLNAINPKYNARTINLYLDTDYVDTGIENRNILHSNNTVEYEETEEKDTNKFYSVNHIVTLLDIPEDDITLMIDPTNPGIGIYKDGKIYSFNAVDKENGYDSKEIMTGALNGSDGMKKIIYSYIKSFLPSKLTLEELETKYGIEAQKKALAQVKALDVVSNTNTEKNQTQSFDDYLKVEIPSINKEYSNKTNEVKKDRQTTDEVQKDKQKTDDLEIE